MFDLTMAGVTMTGVGMTAFHPTANTIIQSSAAQMVECLVEGTLIAIFAGVVLGAMRRQNSGTRFAVWFSALMAIAALPICSGSWLAHAGGVPIQPTSHPAITLPAAWALYVVAAWAVIAFCLLVGVGRGLWYLHILRKSCVPVDPRSLDERVRETLDRKSARRVTLCTSRLVQVPTAIGLMKPLVVIPGWVLRELSTDELNQVVLHELAHLRRWDDWTNLAQKIVKAIFFFHPAVWWIEKKVSLEREMACDDAVLAETASPRAYAECLTHLAEKTLIQRSVVLAQAALGRIRQTSLRVAQILETRRPAATKHAWRTATLLVAGFAFVCVVGISRTPKLVAFSDQGRSPVASPVVAAFTPHAESEVRAPGTSKPTLVAANARSQSANGQAISANWNTRDIPRGFEQRDVEGSERSSKGRASTAASTTERRAGSMVHNANIRVTDAHRARVAVTETFFVVVEDGANGSANQPGYQIQIWRVTVLRSVVSSESNRIPPKQT